MKYWHLCIITVFTLLFCLPFFLRSTFNEDENTFIFVKKENVWYLQDHPEAIALVETTLATDYTLLKNMERTQIYRKISQVRQ